MSEEGKGLAEFPPIIESRFYHLGSINSKS